MTRKYYKYVDTYGPPNGTVYFESENGWVLRQTMVGDHEIIASNVKHPIWGLGLADQQGDYDAIEEVIPIAQAEFDQVWAEHLYQHQAQWAEAKLCHLLGALVHGKIEIFYPQGVIINLSDTALGVANYAECKNALGAKNMYIRIAVTAVVIGYDEVNQWIQLGIPYIRDADKA